ncbi:DUF2834 domain-containing protein [Pseudomonas putida]|uniref:DUF2834 domain-containing protein n=1 Tax=Pseudomonas putida TaxID=303 RepID=UPI0021F8C8F9|nr:DUF2834 domain-containing protein [Pseudomonas putida]
MQFIYLFLCLTGAALPLSQFFPWLAAHSLNVPLLLQQATSSNIAAFAWADVLVSGVAVVFFVIAEGRRLAIPRLWLPLSCLAVGPSLALPLFLLLRERHLAAAPVEACQ